MAGNNSCGSRSIRYGNMVHNVRAIDAVLADGARVRASARCRTISRGSMRRAAIATSSRKMRAIAAREADEIEHALPEGAAAGRRLQHRHDRSAARRIQHGASARRLRGHARLFAAHPPQACAAAAAQGARRVPLPDASTSAMEAPQHIVKLGPGRGGAGRPHDDRPRARQSRVPRRSSTRSCRASPDAILLVEFAGDDRDEQIAQPEAARRADGRPRLPGQRGRDHRRRACSATSGKCARRGSTS